MANPLSRFPIQERAGTAGAVEAVGRTPALDTSVITSRLNKFAKQKLQQAETEASRIQLGRGVDAAAELIQQGKPLQEVVRTEQGVFGLTNAAAASFNRGARTVYKSNTLNDFSVRLGEIKDELREAGVVDFDAEFRRRGQAEFAAIISQSQKADPSGQFVAELTPKLQETLDTAFLNDVNLKRKLDFANFQAGVDDALKAKISEFSKQLQNPDSIVTLGRGLKDSEVIQPMIDEVDAYIDQVAPAMRWNDLQIAALKQENKEILHANRIRGIWNHNIFAQLDPMAPNFDAQFTNAVQFLEDLENEIPEIFGDAENKRARDLRKELQEGLARMKSSGTQKVLQLGKFRDRFTDALADGTFRIQDTPEFVPGANSIIPEVDTIEKLWTIPIAQMIAKGDLGNAEALRKELLSIQPMLAHLENINSVDTLAGVEQLITQIEDGSTIFPSAFLKPGTSEKLKEGTLKLLRRKEAAFRSLDYTEFRGRHQSLLGTFTATVQEERAIAATKDIPGALEFGERLAIKKTYQNLTVSSIAPREAVAHGRQFSDSSIIPIAEKDINDTVKLIDQQGSRADLKLAVVDSFATHAEQVTGRPIESLIRLPDGHLYVAAHLVSNAGSPEAAATILQSVGNQISDADVIKTGLPVDALQTGRQTFIQASGLAQRMNALSPELAKSSDIVANTAVSDSFMNVWKTAYMEAFRLSGDANDALAKANQVLKDVVSSLDDPTILPNEVPQYYSPSVRNNNEFRGAVAEWYSDDWLQANVSRSEVSRLAGGDLEAYRKLLIPKVLPTPDGPLLVLMNRPAGKVFDLNDIARDSKGNLVSRLLLPKGEGLTDEDVAAILKKTQGRLADIKDTIRDVDASFARANRFLKGSNQSSQPFIGGD